MRLKSGTVHRHTDIVPIGLVPAGYKSTLSMLIFGNLPFCHLLEHTFIQIKYSQCLKMSIVLRKSELYF